MRYLKFFLLTSLLFITTRCSKDADLLQLQDVQVEESQRLYNEKNPDVSLEEQVFLQKTSEPRNNGKKEKHLQDFNDIKSEILGKNKNKRFIARLISKVGHPNWDVAFSANESEDGFPYFVPFSKPDDINTRAVLMVTRHKNGKKLDFDLVVREQFFKVVTNPNRENVKLGHLLFAASFQYFDAKIFNYKDEELMAWIDAIKGGFERIRTGPRCDAYSICVETHTPVSDPDGDCSWCVTSSTSCYWYIECSNDPIGGEIDRNTYYGGSSGGSSGSGGGTCTSCEVDANYPQDSDPSANYAHLNESEVYKALIEGFTYDEIGIIDQLKAAIQNQISNLDFILPSTAEEYAFLAEALKIELEKIVTNPRTLATLLLPGVADIESALKNFNSGNILNAAFDLSMALVDLVPGTKLSGVTLSAALVVKRSLPIIKIFKRIKALGNSRIANGFKRTLLSEMKNRHIFRTADGHLGNVNFDYVLSRAGGQFEMIADVYEEAFRTGKLANITSIPTETSVTLYGRIIHFKPVNIYNAKTGRYEIRIDDFYSKT